MTIFVFKLLILPIPFYFLIRFILRIKNDREFADKINKIAKDPSLIMLMPLILLFLSLIIFSADYMFSQFDKIACQTPAGMFADCN